MTLEEQRRVRSALEKFREQHPDSVREVAVKPLLHGVAAHHAGCLPTWKAFIEELFQQGLIKVVFATETLAAGINMPARFASVHFLQRIEFFCWQTCKIFASSPIFENWSTFVATVYPCNMSSAYLLWHSEGG